MKWLSYQDAALSARIALSPTDSRWSIASTVAHIGDGSWVFGSLLAVYLLGWLLSIPALRSAMLALLATLLTTALIVFIIKYTLRRERPRDPTGFVTISYDKYSFPSGHSARMSCLAVTLLYFNVPLGVICLILAILVAAARVLVGVHYVGDVVAGLIVGGVTALLIMNGEWLSFNY